MYVDIVPNRNSPPAVLLRESVRNGKKVTKRTIANLTRWPAERVLALKRALRGEFDGVAHAETRSGKAFGLLFVLKQLADELGISRALGKSPYAKFALFLILARIAHQGSRLSALRWAQDQSVEEILGLSDFDEQDLYHTLDWLAQQQTTIEDRLFQRYVQTKEQPVNLVLYDVTSSYLEGEHNALAHYGYNRDGKKGKKQIVIGLLAGCDGEPLSISVFKGNTSDPATVEQQIKTLKQRFNIDEVVFVGDRGMVKAKGREALKAQGLRYISALTDPEIRKLLRTHVLQADLFDETVCEVNTGQERLILRRNEATYRKEQHRRADKINRLQKYVEQRNQLLEQSKRADPEVGLRNYQAWIRRHKLSVFTTLTLEGRLLIITFDQEAKQQASLLDGCFVLRTDVKETMNAQDIHDRYMDLQQVERDFRTMKTACLDVRPIFVRKDTRTRGHVFVTMLALKLVRCIQQRLAAEFGTVHDDNQAINLGNAIEALNRLTLLHTRLGHQTLTQLPQPDPRQQQILKALNVNWPQYQKTSKNPKM